MACRYHAASASLTELIVVKDETFAPLLAPDAVYEIDDSYEIWYYENSRIPPLSVRRYGYDAIPMCYGLTEQREMEQSGILQLQNINALSLKGQGVFVAIIDTGIRYEDSTFRNPDGTTRIYALWDQTGEETTSTTEELCYGVRYSQTQINEALFSGRPQELVPQTDENGHGTFLASIACGGKDSVADFVGAAPLAELVVVKLKPAKPYLREFYGIPEELPCYAETDIMAAVSYANQIATSQKRPLVILLGLGTSSGNHSGSGPLNGYLDLLARRIGRVIVTATGNEAGSRRHVFGNNLSELLPQRVEMNVEADMQTLCLEFWSSAPAELSIAVQSPTGERFPSRMELEGRDVTFTFVLEGTTVEISRRFVGRARRDQLVFLRFRNIVRGIWTMLIYPVGYATGYFHGWLPMQGMTQADVFFLASDPDTTLCGPSDAHNVISVGGYDGQTLGLYVASGRGFDADNSVKPDVIAPAVAITGKTLFGTYERRSGTSMAAAITAGACAQLLEWSILDGNEPQANGIDIKNRLIRSAIRQENQTYPNQTQGYGRLNAYEAIRLR